MKKPTFSKLSYWLFNNLFPSKVFNSGFFSKKLKSQSFKESSLLLPNRLTVWFLFFIFFFSSTTYSQVGNDFTTRLPGGNIKVKGDLVLIGNTVLNKVTSSPNFSPAPPVNGVPYTGTVTNLATLTSQANIPNNATGNNNDFFVEYIDIDSDPTTFSSSSAELKINNSCKKIVFAGLYWSAIYPYDRSTDPNDKYKGSLRDERWNEVELKTPTQLTYRHLVADEVIFNGYKFNGPNVSDSFKDSPYVCFKDVTSIIGGLADADGVYTLANVRAARGKRNGGSAGGWTLVVIYESPSLPSKFISIFDGYVGVNPDAGTGYLPAVNYDVSGFKTLPVGFPVYAKMGVAALEGDLSITNDSFQFKASTSAAFTQVSDAVNPATNFFNATISDNGAIVTNRTPNSKNTLGFDVDNVRINNPLNSVLPNNATAGTLRLTTSGDGYGAFLSTFAVDIIEPNIQLTKEVQDVLGNDIGNANVTLGQHLYYKIGFQNIGNDDATSFTIKDVLPINIIFNPADIIVPNGSGITFTYDAITRTIIFTIPNNLVNVNDPRYEIRFKVQVVPNCNELSDACSDQIKNQAYATYKGILNQNQITDDPSVSSFTACNLATPSTTNFLVGVDGCKFTKSVILCGTSVDLTAANGYNSYKWSNAPFDNNGNTTGTILGTNQTLTVTNIGTYYVYDTAIAPCLSIEQTVTVSPFGNTVSNPVIPFADEVVSCPNDGKVLPNIFLCGGNATRLIRSGINDAVSIIWEKLDEASCTAVSNSDCANENATCTWTRVASGPDYTANTYGQFRMTINYAGGCFNRFYFNVYQNILNPTVTTKDIICNTPGEITVEGVPSGYEYSLDNVTYQASNVFPISTQNTYTVYIRQTGVTSFPCVFSVPGVFIRERNFTVTPFVTQPFCNGGKGSIKLAANDVRGQYYYKIYQGTTLVNQVGPLAASDYTFSNLNAGTSSTPITYTWDVSTDDGCHLTGTVDLKEPDVLTATSALTVPLTCTDGEITVTPVGGTAPYSYFVNSTTDFQSTPQIVVSSPLPSGGVYNIKVVDNNNCSATTSITVVASPAPDFTISKNDITCSGSGNAGTITVNVNNTNGNTLRYSIDNGVTFVNSPVFTNLAAGSYDVVVEYTLGTLVCTSTPENITINAATPIIGTVTITTPYTCRGSGTITVGASGGTGSYTYSIDGLNFQVSNLFTGLTAGTYTITIKDSNGCTKGLAPLTISSLNGPTDLTFTYKSFDCSDNTSAFNVNWPNGTGGQSPVRFQIIAVPSFVLADPVLYNYLTQVHADGQYSGVPAGLYTFEITDKNGCKYQEDYNLVPQPPISVTATLVNNVKCYGTSTGSFKFDVVGTFTGGNKVYSYTVTGPVTRSAAGQTASTITLGNLPAGDYTITVTDKPTGCTATAPITISQPAGPLTLTPAITPITCSSNDTGSVTATTTGGWGSNNYTLTLPNGSVVGPQGSNTFTNLTLTGNYTLSATDANGCSATSTFTLSPAGSPTATIVRNSGLCFDPVSGASITVNVSGGHAPYSYQVSTDGGTTYGLSSATFTGAPASFAYPVTSTGTYWLKITDSYGCSTTVSQVINAKLTASTITKQLDCTSTPNAVVTGTIVGGTAPFTVVVTPGTGGTLVQPTTPTGTNFTYTTGIAGTYQFQIQDANGCTTTTTATINTITNPTVSANQVNVSCNGLTDGSVQLTGAGGSGGYTYSKDNGAYTPSSSFTGLAAGTYIFHVKDSKDCDGSVSVTITQPAALVATATEVPFSCNTSNGKVPGTVTVNVTAGTGTAPYQYSFNGSGYSSNNVLTLNDNGTNQPYSYSVRDAKGCIASGNGTLLKLNPPTISGITGTAINCAPAATSSTVTVNTTAGTGVGTLTYQITAPAASATSNTTGVFTGLSAGTYSFKVTDANGCYATDFYTVKPLVNIAVTATKLSDVDCYGFSTGAIRYDVSGFAATSSYSYSVNGGTPVTGQTAASFNLTNLSGTTTYNVLFTDETTKCTASTSITISQPTAALAATYTTVNANCNVATSKVTVNVTPGTGTPNYSYSFSNSSSTPGAYVASNVANLDPALTWYAWVKDVKGCTITLPVTLATDPVPTVTASATNQCLGVDNYTITATNTTTPVSGIVNPVTYSINGGASYQSGNTFVVTTAGNYTIKMKDGNGCTADSNVVTVMPKLTLTAVLNKDITCETGNEAAKITLTAIGGSGSYTYSSSPATGSFIGNVFTTTTPGNYTFTITDTAGNSCSASTTTAIAITAKVDPVISSITQTQDIKCNGDQTAAIHANIDSSKGQAPFQFSLDGGPYQSSPDFTGLGASTTGTTYTITVKDAKECTGTNSIIIYGKAPIAFDLTKIEISCNGGSDSAGSITVENVAGGTAPFTYTITNNYGTAVTGNPYTTNILPDRNENKTFTIDKYGIYTVTVTDVNGCSLTKYITMTSPPTDLDIQIALGQPDCVSGGSATVTVGAPVVGNNYEFGIVNSNTPPYSSNFVTPNNGPRSNIFTGLTPGVTYSFVVHDLATNCYFINTTGTPIPPSSGLTATLTPNNVSCVNPGNDGSVTMTVSGYDATATSVDYQVYNAQTNMPIGAVQTQTFGATPPANFTATTPSTLDAGQYYVLLVEHSGGSTNGCTTAIPFEIKKSAQQLDLTPAVLKKANCNPNSGVITVQPLYGTAPYTYRLVGVAPLVVDTGYITSNSFNADAGNYTAYVKDAYGCIVSKPIALGQDNAPTITAPAQSICYDGSTPFTITFSGSVDPSLTGTETYSVNGSAFQTSPSFTFNAAGTYNLVIKDGNGCTAAVDYEVYPKLNLSAALTKILDCTVTPKAEITLTATGGNTTPSANYTYEVSTDGGGTYNPMATDVYSAASAGTYYFRVTDANNTSLCQVTTTFVLDPKPTTVLATPIVTNVSCNGGSDGTIFVEVTSGEGPYKFSLDGGVTEQPSGTFTNLSAGNYTVTVRDARQCLVNTASIEVKQPLQLKATATAPSYTCNANNVPQTVVTVTVDAVAGVPTGTGPYKYKFDGSPTAPYYHANTLLVNDNGLSTPQTIHYYVMDANGCTYDNTVDVQPYQKITDLTFNFLPITCTNPTRDVKVTVVGGYTPIAKYEIVLPNPIDNGNSDTFVGLGAGTYLIKVTDANGCTFEKTLTINPVTNITVSGQLISDVTCNPGTNGAVQFNVANFTGSYSYSINGGVPITGQTNPTVSVTGLTAASVQTINITDETTGCPATASVTVSQPIALSISGVTNNNANCNSGARVSISASGGTPNYVYAFVQNGVAPQASDYTASANAVLDPAVNTQWDVWVKDANGCTDQKDVTIATDPLPSGITANVVSQCPTASGDYSITVNVTSGIGPFEYSLNGGGFQASDTFTVNAPGTYDVTVKDANLCTATVNAAATILDPLFLRAAITVVPTCNDADGEVTLTATGGSGAGNYTYSIVSPASATSNISGAANGIFTGLAPSLTQYTFYVKDGVTNCAKTVDVLIDVPNTTINFNLSTTPVTCKDDNDGTITVTMATSSSGVNDNPIYTYALNGTTVGGASVTMPSQSSQIFSGLAGGSYTVTVTSGRGCSVPKTDVVGEALSPLSVSGSVYGCPTNNPANTVVVTVNGAGGTPGYLYSIDGTNYTSSSTFTIPAPTSTQTLTVYVKDAHACTAINTLTVDPLPTQTVIPNTAITCANDETVTITGTGGSGQFTYQALPAGNPNVVQDAVSPNVFHIKQPGTYYFQVDDTTTGCSIVTLPYEVAPFNTIDVVTTATKSSICFGDTNGELEINVTGYSGAYSYEIFDGQGVSVRGPINADTSTNPLIIGGLLAGNYTVKVKELGSPYCEKTSNSVTIISPPAPLSLSASETANVTCSNDKGTITAVATGGWGTYEYELTGTATVGYSSNGTFTNLSAGNYIVNVRDSGGCVSSKNVSLVIPTSISVTATATTTTVSCFGDKTASISATATGGQGSNYMYTLNYYDTSMNLIVSSGPQASNVFNGLGAGTYTITVTDSWGCSGTSAPVTITEPTKVVTSLAVASTQTCGTLTSLALSATGGTGSYSYSSDGINYIAMSSNPLTLLVPVGTYHYYVKDTNDCISYISNDIQIDPLVPLTINLEKLNPVINCAGDSNGVITAEAQGGLGNYAYTLTNVDTGTVTVPQPSGVFNGLIAGNYKVHVDSGDCTKEVLVTITQPLTSLAATAVATPVTCNGNGDGKIVITASGGTGEIRYAISPRLDQFFVGNTAGGHIFNNLKPGSYTIISQDQNGCFYPETLEITEPAPISSSEIQSSIVQEYCVGDKTGAFNITISGGVAPYSTTLDNPNGVYVLGQVSFTGLGGGPHRVYIKDANGCTYEYDVILDKPVLLDPKAEVSYNCDNDLPGNKVTVHIDPSNNPADVVYYLDSSVIPHGNIFTDVPPGQHFVIAEHKNGCVKETAVFTVNKIETLEISLSLGGLNEIVATATGGSGVYQFTVNGESIGSNNKYIYFHSGDYTVTVTDSYGCSTSKTLYFEFIDIKIPPIFTPNGDGNNDNWKPTNTENYPDIKFIVYDRYGRQVGVFGAGQSWDGKYNGTELPMGDYWYILKLRHAQDDREFVGHFTLYR